MLSLSATEGRAVGSCRLRLENFAYFEEACRGMARRVRVVAFFRCVSEWSTLAVHSMPPRAAADMLGTRSAAGCWALCCAGIQAAAHWACQDPPNNLQLHCPAIVVGATTALL
jgi:hypothetical protein